MEISESDIARFTHEINGLHIKPDQLLFLDEISTDNRSMIRKRWWFLRGIKPVYRSYFQRGSRMSLLSFLGVNGIVETVETLGTFDRSKFSIRFRKNPEVSWTVKCLGTGWSFDPC
eukprot:Pompholyxophrys_punicea_v1_NODE_2106_length_462_cov_1.452088.p1 type:complete len:116 gc:universal NODE_2106_length_462_cov_1.452088:83-430(+)